MTTNTGGPTPSAPLSDGMKQVLRPKLLARGAPPELVDQWLNDAESIGELTRRLIAWCRQPHTETQHAQ